MKPIDANFPTTRKIKMLTPQEFAKARRMPLDLVMRELERGNIAGAVSETTYRIAEGATTRYRAYNLPRPGRKKATTKSTKKGAAKWRK
jgi:hypothetical protein